MPATTSQVIATTDADFETDVLASPVPVLVEFGGSWCGPCLQIAPVLERIAGERAGSLRVVTVNTDVEPLMSTRYRVMGLPTLILFVRGEPRFEIRGARPKAAIDRTLDEALAVDSCDATVN